MDKKILYIQWLRGRGLSERTIKDYSYIIKRLPEHIEQADLDIYFQRYNKRSIDKATIRNYIDFMIEKFPEMRDHYMTLRIPKLKGRVYRKLLDYPTEQEMLKIAEAFPKGRERMMIKVQFYCAMRPQGLKELTTASFLFEEWLANPLKPCKVKVFERKSGHRIALIPKEFAKELYNKINLTPKDKVLFRISYDTWHQYLTKASMKALGRMISPHKLRHGGATWLLNVKGYTLQEVSDFIGHKSIATTQIYAHLDRGKMMDKYGA